jgi:hypothetical protein
MTAIVTKLFFAGTLAAIGTIGGAPSQAISDGELQRMASAGQYPVACNDAQLAANALRSKPTVEKLHAAATAFGACAKSPYGIGSNALANQANFAASAALLLAARNEPPAAAANDARAAAELAQTIIVYRRPSNATGPTRNNDPSPHLTDAGRIERDANALLAYYSPATKTPAT